MRQLEAWLSNSSTADSFAYLVQRCVSSVKLHEHHRATCNSCAVCQEESGAYCAAPAALGVTPMYTHITPGCWCGILRGLRSTIREVVGL